MKPASHLLVVLRLAALAALATLAACGGGVVIIGSDSPDGAVQPPPRDASLDSGAPIERDGSTGPGDAALPPDASSPRCPATKPAANTPCPKIGFECEYGSDPSTTCNSIVQCEAGGWVDVAPGAGTQCTSGVCPSTYPGATATVCSPNGLVCSFSQGTCTCSPPVGPPSADSGPEHWQCFPAQSGCPEPRPQIGSPCVSANGSASCNYGACAGGVEMACTQGVWTVVSTPCPS